MLRLGTSATLQLADGQNWKIVAGDPGVEETIRFVKRVLRLGSDDADARRLVVSRPVPPTLKNDRYPAPFVSFSGPGKKSDVSLVLNQNNSAEDIVSETREICRVISQYATSRGSVFLHAGLAELQRHGILLLGKSGIGKTTATDRLPWPWKPLCDDHVLTVREPNGSYKAHPFPTWSQLAQSPEETWPTEYSVPLVTLFFLDQGITDSIRPIGAGETVCRLVTAAEEADRLHWVNPRRASTIRTMRLDNSCELARAVPAFILTLSKTGTFWKIIEDVLEIAQPNTLPRLTM